MASVHESLLQSYRPQVLDDIIGQDPIVGELRVFLQSPYSVGMLFDGPTGTGKTSTAMALARELGVDIKQREFGGLHRIPAGEQNAESVRELRHNLSVIPWYGSRWKLAIIDEADHVSPAAAQVWLDVLERLPGKSVVVFTTNHPEKLPRRFRDRCERFSFVGDALLLGPGAQRLVDRIWRDTETPGPVPRWAELGEDLVDEDQMLSIRRVVQGAEKRIRQIAAAD